MATHRAAPLAGNLRGTGGSTVLESAWPTIVSGKWRRLILDCARQCLGVSNHLFAAPARTIAAHVFGHPFIGRHFDGFSLTHELGPRVHLSETWLPVRPNESLWLTVHFGRLAATFAFAADDFAMLATRTARTRNAKVLALAAPANDFHVLFFANKPAHLFARRHRAAPGTLRLGVCGAHEANRRESNKQTNSD